MVRLRHSATEHHFARSDCPAWSKNDNWNTSSEVRWITPTKTSLHNNQVKRQLIMHNTAILISRPLSRWRWVCKWRNNLRRFQIRQECHGMMEGGPTNLRGLCMLTITCNSWKLNCKQLNHLSIMLTPTRWIMPGWQLQGTCQICRTCSKLLTRSNSQLYHMPGFQDIPVSLHTTVLKILTLEETMTIRKYCQRPRQYQNNDLKVVL